MKEIVKLGCGSILSEARGKKKKKKDGGKIKAETPSLELLRNIESLLEDTGL